MAMRQTRQPVWVGQGVGCPDSISILSEFHRKALYGAFLLYAAKLSRK